MEIINRIELIIGSIGIVIGLFSASFLFLKKNIFSKPTIFIAIYLLIFSVRMSKSLFYQHITISFTLHQIFLSSLLIIGPTLWFYLLSISDKLVKKSDYFFHCSSFIIVSFLSFFIDLSYSSFFYLGVFFHGISYCSFLLYSLYFKNNQYNLNERFFKWIVLLVTVTFLLFINSILIFFNVLPFYPSSAFLFSFIIILLFSYGLNNIELFKAEKKKYASSNLSKEVAEKYFKKLSELIEKERLYLDPELSLTKLSSLIGISPKELSQVINQLKNTNYSQYIMNYRVEEVKRKLKDPKYTNYKISAIAFESGFNSVSSFNNAFKKITNTTAIKYRAS